MGKVLEQQLSKDSIASSEDQESHCSLSFSQSSTASFSPSCSSSSEIAAIDQVSEKKPVPVDREMEEMKAIFRKYDANGDGRISFDELRAVLRSLGADVSPPGLLRDVMAEIDTDGDGFVDFQEFAVFHRSGAAAGNGEGKGEGKEEGRGGAAAELRQAFEVYDKDGNGKISASELQTVMKQLGEKVSRKECARMIKTVDLDGDGSVNFEEFAMMMSKPWSAK